MADAPITFGLILKWVPVVALLVTGGGAGVSAYVSLQARVTTLETRAAETASDHQLLLNINRKIDLFICKSDPLHCETQ